METAEALSIHFPSVARIFSLEGELGSVYLLPSKAPDGNLRFSPTQDPPGVPMSLSCLIYRTWVRGCLPEHVGPQSNHIKSLHPAWMMVPPWLHRRSPLPYPYLNHVL